MDARASRGSRAAAIGAVLGLVPAAGLGLLSFYNSGGPPGEHIAGAVSLALVYASPYVVVLIASRVRSAGARGGLLVPIGLLSLAASFSSMSLVTVAFLPATVFIWVAAARSLTATAGPLTTTLFTAAGGAVIAAVIVLGFLALFILQEDEARCWVLSPGQDGQPRWESRPNVGGPDGLSTGVIFGDGIGHCTSDVITPTEAAASAGLLALALTGALLMTRRRWPDSSSEPSTSS